MIDWTEITNRLRSSRGSLVNVAREINACPVHLRRLSRGEIMDTKFQIGVKLLDMHMDDYPDKHRDIAL